MKSCFQNGWLRIIFTPVDELQISGETARNLIWSRDAIFAWLYKNETQNIAGILSKVSVNMIKDSIKKRIYFQGCETV